MALEDAVQQAMAATNEVFRRELIPAGAPAAAVERVYTTSATVMPPGAELVRGREAIQSFWAGAIEALEIRDVALQTLNAEHAGDTVVEIGRADLTLGSGTVVVAKYVVHWKQEDGAWKWHVDIWNVNA